MAGLDPVRLERAAALCQGDVDSGQMPCTSLLVARHGEIAMRRDYGLMDVAEGKPLAEDALFRIFSMTKPLTCIAGLVCYEMGCFQLDDPVSLYLPEFNEHDDPAAPLTIEHCFTHTNGVQDTTGNTPTNLAEKVAQLAASPRLFPPGSAWKYGPGHDVIGRLTEVFTGMPYADFLREAVLAPTGMEDTSFVVPGERGRFQTTVIVPRWAVSSHRRRCCRGEVGSAGGAVPAHRGGGGRPALPAEPGRVHALRRQRQGPGAG